MNGPRLLTEEGESVTDTTRLPVEDKDLEAGFALEVESPDAVKVACRAPGCSSLWRVPLRNGVVPAGWRNSLLAHLQAHAPGASKYGRLPR